MPKATKYYAVKVGREGKKVYNTWDECKSNVSRWPGAVHKSFLSSKEALDWLALPDMQRNASYIPKSNATPETAIVIDDSDNSDIEFVEASFASKPRPAKPEAGSSRPPPVPFQHSFDDDSDIEFVEPSTPRPPKAALPTVSVPKEEPILRKIVLSPEQAAILQQVKDGKSVFFTGSAGTGKSVLLREIIAACGGRDGRGSEILAITASTGIAAVNIGGSTLHSFAGVGLGEETAKKYIGKFKNQDMFKKTVARWRNVKTLIIDEISMIDGTFFDKLEEIARGLRNKADPFGGIQLVLSGDFCQLPPVPGRSRDGSSITAVFAFDAASWNKCVGAPVTLTKVFRQKDQKFVNMLNAMRFGELDNPTIESFKQLSRKVVYNDLVQPTELFPTRAEVDGANAGRLGKLPGEPLTYNATDMPGRDSNGMPISHKIMNTLLERLVVPIQITLKVGAQVMLVKNLQQGRLVNGSVGTVIDFQTATQAIENKTAIGVIESGQPGPPSEDPKVRKLASDRAWPLVRFTNGCELLCIPQDFTVNNALGQIEAQRSQIPLILAWAMSIHKSQGQTLERVKIDLRRIFEKGQAYVALSRATTMEHLEVANFDPAKVVAHPRVIWWHQKMSSSEPDFDEIEEMDDMDDILDEMDSEEAMQSYDDWR